MSESKNPVRVNNTAARVPPSGADQPDVVVNVAGEKKRGGNSAENETLVSSPRVRRHGVAISNEERLEKLPAGNSAILSAAAPRNDALPRNTLGQMTDKSEKKTSIAIKKHTADDRRPSPVVDYAVVDTERQKADDRTTAAEPRQSLPGQVSLSNLKPTFKSVITPRRMRHNQTPNSVDYLVPPSPGSGGGGGGGSGSVSGDSSSGTGSRLNRSRDSLTSEVSGRLKPVPEHRTERSHSKSEDEEQGENDWAQNSRPISVTTSRSHLVVPKVRVNSLPATRFHPVDTEDTGGDVMLASLYLEDALNGR